MEEKFYEYVKRYEMIQRGDRVIVGVSGGADSVCLFYLLKNLQKKVDFSFCAVHVNHNIRGEEALRDAHYVEEICQEEGIEYFCFSYFVVELAKKWHMGEEEAGRVVRRQAFLEQADKWNANKIALAHHQNDLAETVLHNMIRGSGLTGICSLKPVRKQWIRPLLCMNRVEIEHYLSKNHIKYVVDSTNLQMDYTRNKIRGKILNEICEVNPQGVRHIAEFSEIAEEAESFLREEARKKYEKYAQEEERAVKILVGLFQEASIIQKYVLRMALEYMSKSLKDITSIHLYLIMELSNHQVGKKLSLPEGIVIQREYDGIRIEKQKKKEEKTDFELNVMIGKCFDFSYQNQKITIDLGLESKKMEKIQEKTYTKWLDYGKIKERLTIRNRRAGDYFVINDKGDRKKLKEYFINEKIPNTIRDEILLLACGSEILWIIGYRLNFNYRVSPDTKEIIKIQIAGGKYYERDD